MGKQYEMAFQIGAKVQGNFTAAFRNAASSVQGLQTQIDSLNKKQGDISSYQKTQQAIEKTKQKLSLYQQQYANLKAEMDRNGQASAAEQNALLQKAKAIDDLKDKQSQLEGKLASTGEALQKEGVDLNDLSNASQQTAQQLDQLKQKQIEVADASGEAGNKMSQAITDASSVFAAAGITEGLKKIYEGFKECAEQAIAFEAEMAAVRRTTGGSEAYIAELGEAFKDISTEIPITTSELAQIATTAGQLGVAQDKVEQFTVVMAKLATTTDLTADEAATMLAQFANITGVDDYERIGAVVAQLGDSTATTASKVVQMSQGMAAAASLAGMSSTDIMAISAALGSLGIEAQAGSTSMSQLINTLYKATETGENLEQFASVAGMTAAQFKQAWATDAVGAMNSFITGLNDVERNGASAIVILDQLGISNVRQQKAILGLASAGNLLANTIQQANTAWEENTALEEKASIMYDTTQAKLTMMNSSFNNLGIAIGDAFAPVIGEAADALNKIIQPVTQFIEENPALVKAIGAAAAVIGVVAAAMAAYTIAAKVAAAASAAFTAAMPGGAAILAVAAGIALVTGVVVGLSDSTGSATESVDELTESYEDLMEKVEHQNHIIDLCEDYKKLNKQSEYAVDNFKEMEGFSDITISATADPTVNPDEFLIDGDHYVTIEGWPEDSVDADLLLDADGNVISVVGSPEGSVDADLLLDEDGNTVLINGSPVESVDADLLLDSDGNVVDINGNPVQSVDADLLLDEDGNSVDVDGKPGAPVSSSDLVSGGPVGIDGKAGDTKVDADDLVKNHGIVLTATEPDKEHKLEASVFVNGQLIEFEASWSNRDEFEKDVENLKAQAQIAKKDLADAQTTYDHLKEYKSQLLSRQKFAKTDSEKDSLSAQLAEVNEQISAQEEELGRLQTAYDEAGGKYVIAANAANTLAEKEERLAAIQAELGISTDGVTEGMDSQTEAILSQIDAVEGLTRAEKEASKLKLIGYLGDKSEEYGWSYTSNVTQRNASSAKGLLEQKEAVIPIADYWLQQGYEAYNTKLKSNLAQLDALYESGQNHSAEYFNLLSETQQMYGFIPSYIPGVRNDKKGVSPAFSLYGEGGVSEGGRPAGATFSDYYPYIALEGQEVLTTAALNAYNDVENQREYVESIVSMQQDYIEQLAQNVNLGVISPEEMENLVNTYVTDATVAEQTIEAVKERVVSLRSEVEGAADSASNTALDVQNAVQPIIDQMNELSEAYAQAYDSAYQSISGQFKLFEEMEQAKPGEKSVDDYIAALNSQKAYMDQYTENLAAVKEMGLSDAMISQLSDGSKESAEILATIVEQGATKIDELNDAYASVETGKQQFADTVAEMETDFTNKMKSLEEQLNTTVESMNQSEAAATAGADTMQAFADAAAGKQSAVESAFAKVAAAALRKLTSGLKFPGFAGGTHNAPEGFAMVGENGPELVYLHGGERILDAQETQRTMDAMSLQPVNAMSASGSGGQYSIEYKPQYNISGSMNAEELQDVLDRHDAGMRDRLEEMLDDIENDRTRRKYA